MGRAYSGQSASGSVPLCENARKKTGVTARRLELAAPKSYEPTPMATLPPKKQVALALLERSSVFIHLDPRGEGVRVPKWFKKQAQLVLRVGLNMAVQIPDLDVDEHSVSCTLSFNRSPHYCYLPWASIYALVGEDGCGMVWPEDVPPEVAAQSENERLAGGPMAPPEPAGQSGSVAGSGARQNKRRRLRPVKEHAAAPAAPAPQLQVPPAPPRRPSLVPMAAGSQPTGDRASPRPPRAMPSYLRLVK
jgi:stringent starvation protein B